MGTKIEYFLTPATRSRIRKLSAKEKRELAFLFTLMVDQQDWLLDNLKWIVKNSKGDIIQSWLCQYISDPFGYAEPIPEAYWNGCLADYRAERDQIIEQWYVASMGGN